MGPTGEDNYPKRKEMKAMRTFFCFNFLFVGAAARASYPGEMPFPTPLYIYPISHTYPTKGLTRSRMKGRIKEGAS
jgi:hypothetical protein